MEQFISLVIFSLPGLLTYFWIQMFGITPVVKHTTTEMVGLIALLWIPTTFLTILLYDLLFLILNCILIKLEIKLYFLDLKIISDLTDLYSLSSNLFFLCYYLFLSIIFSFSTAYIWSNFLYSKLLDLINKVRIKRKTIKLSEEPTVWESFFYKLEDQKEEQLVVEIYKLDKPEEKLCGPVVRMSRPFEIEKSIIIDTSKGWSEAHNHYEYSIKKTYVDTKTGLIINELDTTSPKNKVIT